MRYRIHYANGRTEEVETSETREQLLAQAQPILDVIALEEEDAGKKQAAVQVDGGSSEQSQAGQGKEDSSDGGEGVHVENKKRKVAAKKS